MKLKVIFKKDSTEKKYERFFIEFMKYLQKYLPLKKDLEIIFLKRKFSEMTTGSRHTNGKIYVLSANRLNRDILRTIAHEWTHEYQINVLGRKKGPNIGGKNEDEANASAGRLIKMFERDNPQFIGIEYE